MPYMLISSIPVNIWRASYVSGRSELYHIVKCKGLDIVIFVLILGTIAAQIKQQHKGYTP
jgi:hypothetical protein